MSPPRILFSEVRIFFFPSSVFLFTTSSSCSLYFFSAIKAWVPYEGVQADVFDHVLAIIPEFDLHVFQNPTGEDFRELSKRN